MLQRKTNHLTSEVLTKDPERWRCFGQGDSKSFPSQLSKDQERLWEFKSWTVGKNIKIII